MIYLLIAPLRRRPAAPRRRAIVLLLALILALLPAGLRPAPAGAATCQVTTTQVDGGAGSLRALIANPGCAAITFAAGVTQVPLATPLEIARSVTVLGPGVTLRHVGPPGGVGIPGFPTGNVLTIRAGTVDLRGLTITGGLNLGSWGGGLTVIGAPGAPVDLTLNGVTVDRNAALGGGGIYASNASLLLYDTTISNNGATTASDPSYGGGGLFIDDVWGAVSAYMVRPTVVGNGAGNNQGGGIRVWHRAAVGNATVTAVDGTIGTAAQPNTANSGGGLAADGGRATLIRTAVGGNRARDYGGGLFAIARGAVSMLDSTVSGNNAGPGGGGGLAIGTGGTATLTNSTVNGNNARAEGGGLALLRGGTATLTNSTVSGNNTEGVAGGGGLYVEEGTATLDFVTVTGNSVSWPIHNAGGGLSLGSASGAIVVRNSIVAGNLINGRYGPDCEGTYAITSQGHNIWGDQATCPNNAAGGDRNLAALRLGIAAVLNPTLADNGGPTQTHDLVPSGPAVGRIPAAGCDRTTDQRGVARPQWIWCDSGAVESTARPIFHPAGAGDSPAP